ncbi:hypothetical protein KI688_001661 [Linnemannia hyalina]|uniref:non-specific serine/threonine protein kinase n=1 Tax=Linnemannia hyalina TaxID=64524 RepID=A0A9P7XS93_9FUNG|nr:hypothetical protein KI688_001661 [Linnemannia hyalina]
MNNSVENATGQVIAIKVLNLDTEEEDVSDIQREIATLSQLKNCDSQNITRYHGSFLNGTKLWIVMDYAAGGSIRSLLQALTRIDEKCIAVIGREVLQALGYLHKHGIIHRDIKAANILLTDEGRVQLCDFGVAGQVTMNSLKRNSFVGTPYWMAPEVIREGQTYDFKADIWSFGITIYEIATGNPPFADQDPMRAVTLIPKSRPAQLEGDWSPAMKEFVALCLHEEPNERPSAEDLLKTKWIKSTSKSPLTLLKDLVAKYEQHKIEAALNKEETSSDIDIDHELESFDMEVDPDAWRFDTAKTLPPMTPSRTSSLSKPDSKSDHPNGVKSPALSAQDSGVVIQGRSGKSSDHNLDNATSIPSPGATSPTVKAKASPTSPRNSKKALPIKSQPAVITHESHPLLRLFMHHKSASEEDVSTSHSLLSPQGPHMASAPMTLTIPNLEEITNARLASRSPVPSGDLNTSFDQFHPSQHQYPAPANSRQQDSGPTRMPFGFNMSKPFRFDRRPSAPVVMGSAPGQDHGFHNRHVLTRGPGSSSALTSPRAVPVPTQSSLLTDMHQRQSQQDSDSSQHSSNKGVHSHEIVLPNQLQGVQPHNVRPSSTPSSPAIPPVGMMESTPGAGSSLLNPSQTGTRRPSPSMSHHQQEQAQQQQPHPVRQAHDARSNLPPQIPHRKASLDFSQSERFSHLRPSLPIRPPSATSVRSSTFHGLDSGPTTNISHGSDSNNHSGITGPFGTSFGGLSSNMAALSMQPINISEEKLPPFGHSPAHLRMINALPDNNAPSMNGVHRGSVTMSEKDGVSPASSVNGDGATGSHHSGPNHGASSSSSSASSVSSASLPNSAAISGSFGVTGSGSGSGPNPGVVMARPGLRTVGSSENFARRIRSASMLRRTEEQDNISKGAFQPSRPPQATGAPPGQQQPMQHYQQQQYSYNHEPGSADISRYRRASSPRRRSISMTNLNGLSIIMIPPKKGSDDYSTNPLLLPPSPSTTRFIAPSSMNVTALSSSPLRPTLHSMASSSSLSSSFGSVSGAFPGNQLNGGRNSNSSHGLQQQQQQQQHHPHQQYSSTPIMSAQNTSSLSSSVPTSTVPSSPPTLAQVTNNNHHNSSNNIATVNGNSIHSSANHNMSSTYNETLTATPGGAKSAISLSGTSYHQGANYPGHGNHSNNLQLNASGLGHLASHNGSATTLVGSNSHQNLSQHLVGQERHHHQHLQSQQHQQHQQQQQQQQQLQMQRQMLVSPMHMLIVTPEPRPLQMDALRRNEDLMEELQLTMNDLSQWLEVFETGIKTVRSS